MLFMKGASLEFLDDIEDDVELIDIENELIDIGASLGSRVSHTLQTRSIHSHLLTHRSDLENT